LQNDFFLNPECRLSLPEPGAAKPLIGGSADELPRDHGERHLLKAIERGPLGLFLQATVGQRLRAPADCQGSLTVINIRDWHVPGPSYDGERRLYGRHCERGTWGAGYIDGLEQYLDPLGSPDREKAHFFHADSLRIHHVHSDSLFDFRPRQEDDARMHQGKFLASELEEILDGVIQDPDRGAIYVAVIGVFTDLKVRLLLAGLRTRYRIPNLAVSDTLTAAASLERHIDGLDFIDKVLKVEVIHGVNDLVRFMGGSTTIENERELVGDESFARYRTYFADKQNVLSYQDEKLREYLTLTENRSIKVYERISRANTFLLIFGSLFLVLTLIAAILNLADPGDFDWKVPLVTGGIGLLQLVAAFFSKPTRDLQRNLTNLAVFKMILESHSLKTAFVRYHLTTPKTLGEIQSAAAATTAGRQIGMLREQLEVIEGMDGTDYSALAALGFGSDGEGAPAPAPVPSNGEVSTAQPSASA
jgi:nicotinamidase-related amidase